MLHAIELWFAFLGVAFFSDWACFLSFIAAMISGEVKMLLCITFRSRFDGFFGVSAYNGLISLSTKSKLIARDEDAIMMVGVEASQVELFSLPATSAILTSMTMSR